MKKIFTLAVAIATICSASAELPKAFYVKSGDTYSKYNFGVAGSMKFQDNGNKLQVTGYDELIDLSKVDWISFNAPTDMGLTPSEQKQKMIEIGEEVNKRINLNDYAEILRMADRYLNHCCMSYPEEWEDLYDDDDDVSLPSNRQCLAAGISHAMQSVRRIAKGDMAASRALKKDGLFIYRLADLNGIYRVQDEDNDAISWNKNDYPDLYWKKIADADHFELRFSAVDGGTYYMIVNHSSEYVEWEEKDGIVQIPATIEIVWKKNEQTLSKAEIKLTPNQTARTLDMTLAYTAGELKVNNKMHVTNYKIADTVTVDLKGERLVTSNATINGNNLTDYDSVKDDFEAMDGKYDDDGWTDGDDGEALLRHFRNATADADILGKLQLHGKIAKIDTWYKKLNDGDEDQADSQYDPFKDNYDPDKNSITYCHDDKDEILRQADFLGRYSDLYFTYDGKPEMQGYLTYGCEEDSYEYETDGYYKQVRLDSKPSQLGDADSGMVTINGKEEYVYFNEYYNCWTYETYVHLEIPATVFNIYYDLMPYLTFPDGTSYLFDENEFFNEKSFGLLIDDYNVIIDTYESIVK